MSKHTPGPWTAQERCNNMIDIWHSNKSRPGAITLALCRVQARPTWIDEAQANAHLIAAAPDLLEALTELLAEAKGGSAESKARAAIAKATGGEL